MGRGMFALAGLLVIVCVSVAPGQQWADKLFGMLEQDFGGVKRGVKLKHSFLITNIYKVPIEITDIRTTCGCMKTNVPAKHLKPGDSATIDIELDTARFSGMKTMKIFVTVGPQFVSTAMLTVRANAK